MPTNTLKDFAYSVVAAVNSSTEIEVLAGTGAYFSVGDVATLWPSGESSNNTNAELCPITAIVSDTLTITRTGSPNSVTIIAGFQVAQTITAAVMDEIYGQMFANLSVAKPASSSATGTPGQWHYDDVEGVFYRCVDTDTWIAYSVINSF